QRLGTTCRTPDDQDLWQSRCIGQSRKGRGDGSFRGLRTAYGLVTARTQRPNFTQQITLIDFRRVKLLRARLGNIVGSALGERAKADLRISLRERGCDDDAYITVNFEQLRQSSKPV